MKKQGLFVMRLWIVIITIGVLAILTAMIGFEQKQPIENSVISNPPAAETPVMALDSYKALYDLSLVSAKPGSQLIDIDGDLFFEWREECEGWIVDQSYTMHYNYIEGQPTDVSSQFSSWEAKDKTGYRFATKRHRNQEVTGDIQGKAEKNKDNALTIAYQKPNDITFEGHMGTVFPTEHTVLLLEKARAGEKFFTARFFDGSDETGPLDVTAFITRQVEGDQETWPETVDTALLPSQKWQMRLAFFPLEGATEISDYEMTMIMHDNGVVSDLVIDYASFSLRGKLKALESAPAATCDS